MTEKAAGARAAQGRNVLGPLAGLTSEKGERGGRQSSEEVQSGPRGGPEVAC